MKDNPAEFIQHLKDFVDKHQEDTPKQQTAVDFFYNEVWLCFSNKLSWTECERLTKIKEQAKEMEKERMIEAFKHGELPPLFVNFDAEQYYEQTYGGNKQECQFEPDSNLTSATKCKWCDLEKWQHKTYGGKK